MHLGNSAFSGLTFLIPAPDSTALTTAKLIVREIVGRYSTPTSIISDKGHVYEITKIPLLVPGLGFHYNILATNFHAFGYHPDADHLIIFPKESDIPTTGYLDLRTTHLHLHSRTRPSCATSLMYGDLEQIKEHCGFHIYHTYLTPTVYRIDSDLFFLSNITTIEVSCPNSTDLMAITG